MAHYTVGFKWLYYALDSKRIILMHLVLQIWRESVCEWSIKAERPSVCQVRKWPCCYDETNNHRNPVFRRGANLSCPATTRRMYRTWSNLLLAHENYYEGENCDSNTDRKNGMDSCIKRMRPCSHTDLNYTTVYHSHRMSLSRMFFFLQLFHWDTRQRFISHRKCLTNLVVHLFVATNLLLPWAFCND